MRDNDLAVIRGFVERRLSFANSRYESAKEFCKLRNLQSSYSLAYWDSRVGAYDIILGFIDSLQEEVEDE